MVNRGTFKALALVVAVGLSEFSAVAEGHGTQYVGIAVPPYEFYEALLGLADAGDHEGLRKAVKYLGSLVNVLRKEMGDDSARRIEAAMASGKEQEVKKAVLRFIFQDLMYHMKHLREGNADQPIKEDCIQMAFTVYQFLAPAVARKDAGADREIRKRFKELYRDRRSGAARALSDSVSTRIEAALFKEANG